MLTPRTILGSVLVLAGAVVNVPIVIGLGLVTVGVEVARRAWQVRGIDVVGFRRHLGSNRLPWGETTELTLETWNRGPLPLSWVRTDEEVTAGVVVPERTLVPGDLGDMILRNTWTLGPRELVRRRLRVGAERRGVYEIGPTQVSSGDVFALPAGEGEWPAVDRFLVWPRTVPAPPVPRRERWGGVERARHGLTEDPARFVGVRPYQPGDPIRRLHARTSARLGRPMTKRFEPSRDRDVFLVLDLVPAERHEATWYAAEQERELEGLIVIAASLVRSLGLDHVPFGLAAAGYTGPDKRIASLPVGSAPGQVERGLDLLARLASGPAASFERLAAWVGRTVRTDTTVLVLTGRDPGPLLPSLRALRRHGLAVGLLVTGDDAADGARRAQVAGFPADVIRLDGPWETAARVLVA